MKSIVILLLLVSNLTYAQDIEDVSISDFDQTSHPLDSLAGASYMFTTINIEYRINDKIDIIRKHHDRIMIYNEEGEEYAKFEIGLSVDGRDRERIKSIKAVTYNLENGEIVKTKLDKKQIFDEQVSEYYNLKKFALPKVKAGSIIDVYYEIVSPFIYTTPMFYFQDYIPVDFGSYKLTAPNIINLAPVAKGYAPFEHNTRKRTVGSYSGREIVYTVSNLKSIKDDDYVLNENDYRSGLKFELHSINWPNSGTDYYSKSWESIGQNLHENLYFGKQLKKYIEPADEFLEDISSLPPMDRAKRIYDFVRVNYAWNEESGRYSEKGLKDFAKKKTGNIADVNLLLTNLLLKSEIEAYPFVIKPRQYGLLNEGYPSLTEISYVTTMIFVDGQSLILDASSKDHPFGMLPLRAINYNGLLVKDDHSEMLEVSNENKILTLRKVTYDINLNDDSLDGVGNESCNDFASVKYRLKIKDLDEDSQDIEDYDDEDYDDEDTDDFDLEDEFEVTDIINLDSIYGKIKYDFTEKKFSTHKKIGSQIFINADLDLGISKNPFIEDKREYPVFYNNKVDLRRIAFVNIPEGYEVDSLPEKLIMSLPNKTGQFVYEASMKSFESNQKQIMISMTFKISKLLFLPEEYEALKKFYDLVIDKQSEKIILREAN